MPQIREYVSQNQANVAFNPRRQRAQDFADTTGLRKLGQGIASAGDVIQQRQEQTDLSNISVKISQAQADFTNQLRENLRTADPGDTTITDKFLQSYDDYMSKAAEGIETHAGQQYFTRASAALRSQLSRSAAAGQAELAGVHAKQNYVSTLNNYSSSLVNDPSAFDDIKEHHDEVIANLVKSGGLSSAVAEQLKTQGTTELAKSAVRGWIQINPDEAKAQLKSGKWNSYFDGDVVKQLDGEADQAIRAKEIDKARADLDQKRALKLKQDATQNSFLQKLTKNTLTAKDILGSNLDPFGSGSKDQFLRMLKAQNDGPIKTDSATFENLFQRIHAQDGDPNKIRDENQLNEYLIQGKLSYSDLNHLRQEFDGRKTESGRIESQMKKGVLDAAKAMLTKSNPMIGFVDPLGDEHYQSYMIWFNNAYRAGRKAGKSPQDLLDPTSKDYLGKNIRNFLRSSNEIMQDLTGSTAALPLSVPSMSKPHPAVDPAKMKRAEMINYLKTHRGQ